MWVPPPRHTTRKVRCGRSGVRTALVTAVLLAVATGLAHGQAVDRPAVTIGRDGTCYTVAAQFSVPQPVTTVLEVLSDYEGIPRFMPDIKKSIVHERTQTRTVVEQEAISRVMLFSKRLYLMLEVHRDHDTLRFSDISRRSFRRYEGAWHVKRHDGQTVIVYRLTADPSFSVPAFLIRRLLERDAHETIDRLRGEISRRGSRGAGDPPRVLSLRRPPGPPDARVASSTQSSRLAPDTSGPASRHAVRPSASLSADRARHRAPWS